MNADKRTVRVRRRAPFHDWLANVMLRDATPDLSVQALWWHLASITSADAAHRE